MFFLLEENLCKFLGCGLLINFDHILLSCFYFKKYLQSTSPHAQTAAVSSTSNFRKSISPNSPRSSRNNPVVRNQTEKTGSSKPLAEAGNGYDSKLVEMINTAIVDRSPSVKWEDVGESSSLSLLFNFFGLKLFLI